jgi:outer membrane receptor protein involved in Fe transport
LIRTVYADYTQKPNDRISITYGLRLSIFQNIGKADVILYQDPRDNVNITRIDTLSYEPWETVVSYINLEPRFLFLYQLNSFSSLKASYNRMVQNTHLISSGTLPLPFNTWSPSNYYLKPQVADQYAIGVFSKF